MCNEYFDRCATLDVIKEVISENAMDIKYNNYPEDNAPSRMDMPQTDKGRYGKDKQSAYPNSDGSALNKMKNGKFVKNAIK